MKRRKQFITHIILLFLFLSLVYLSLPTVEADPSTVGNTSTDLATSHPNQRKNGYQNGRFWVFYTDGTNMVFKTSVTGEDGNWSSATTVRPSSDGYQFSVEFNSTHIAYAYTLCETGSTDVKYRLGETNSSGGITWCASEQTVFSEASIEHNRPSIVFDSNNLPWISVYRVTSSATDPQVKVFKSQWNNGSWSSASGFPKSISLASLGWWSTTLVSLTNGKMYLFYAKNGNNIIGRLWNGTDFEGGETVSSYATLFTFTYSAVPEGDYVHFVYCRDIVPRQLRYRKRTTSWQTEVLLDTLGDEMMPPIAIDNSTGNLYVFYNTPLWNNRRYIRVRIYADGAWQPFVTIANFTTGVTFRSLTGQSKVLDGKLACVWAYSDVEFQQYNPNLNVLSQDAEGGALASTPVYFNTTQSSTNSLGWANKTDNNISDYYNIKTYWRNFGIVNQTNSDSLHYDKALTVRCKNLYVDIDGSSRDLFAVSESTNLSDVSFFNYELKWKASGSGENVFKVYSVAKPYYVKVDTTIYVEGSHWVYDSTNHTVTITHDLGSTHDFTVCYQPASKPSIGGGETTKEKEPTDEFKEKVLKPIVTVLQSEIISILMLFIFCVGMVVCHVRDNPVGEWLFFIPFVFLFVELLLSCILIPLGLIPQGVRKLLILPPTLTLETYPIPTQQMITTAIILGFFAVAGFGLWGISRRD